MYKLIAVKTVDVCDVNRPEFLQVDIEIENKKLSIIGTRIKTKSDTKLIQYNYLKSCFNNIDRFLCLGDFNCVHNTLSEYFSSVAEVYGPRIVNDYHSFVFKDGDRVGLDWLVEKGLDSSQPFDAQNSTKANISTELIHLLTNDGISYPIPPIACKFHSKYFISI